MSQPLWRQIRKALSQATHHRGLPQENGHVWVLRGDCILQRWNSSYECLQEIPSAMSQWMQTDWNSPWRGMLSNNFRYNRCLLRFRYCVLTFLTYRLKIQPRMKCVAFEHYFRYYDPSQKFKKITRPCKTSSYLILLSTVSQTRAVCFVVALLLLLLWWSSWSLAEQFTSLPVPEALWSQLF